MNSHRSPSVQALVEVAVKHFPPSPSDLHLIDVGGIARPFLGHRKDIMPHTASLRSSDWQFTEQSMDALVAIDVPPHALFLKQALSALRNGGRMLVMLSQGDVHETYGEQLKQAGFVRLLVERATPQGGLLIRGERPHITDDTHQRVQIAASRDAQNVDWSDYKGRYVHLLIQQTPNKPVWRLAPAETIEWHAVAVQGNNQTTLLAFSSLPKAVAFMQPAVVQGFVKDINKVAKFNLTTAQQWHLPALLNPTLEDVQQFSVHYHPIDPDTAEQPDE
jgi:hypothetical protein